MKIKLFFILVSAFFVINAQQNTNCEQKLVLAENQLKFGLFSESELTIKDVLDNCHLSRKHKIEAYEVLARINVENDNLTDAFKNIKKIIRINHNYSPDKSRLEEDYIKYVSKYKVTPAFSAGLYAEILFPEFVTVGDPNVIMGDFNYSTPYRSEKINTTFGINITYGLPTNTRLSFCPGWSTINYTREIAHKTFQYYFTNIHETDQYLNLPFEINQHFKINKFTGYVGAGYNYSLIQNANAVIFASYPVLKYDTNFVDVVPYYDLIFNETTNTSTKKLRDNVHTVKFNVGLTYNISNFIIDLKLSYAKALNLCNSKNYYLDENITYRTYYIDNNFYYKYFSLNLSINYIILYKINKKK